MTLGYHLVIPSALMSVLNTVKCLTDVRMCVLNIDANRSFVCGKWVEKNCTIHLRLTHTGFNSNKRHLSLDVVHFLFVVLTQPVAVCSSPSPPLMTLLAPYVRSDQCNNITYTQFIHIHIEAIQPAIGHSRKTITVQHPHHGWLIELQNEMHTKMYKCINTRVIASAIISSIR